MPATIIRLLSDTGLAVLLTACSAPDTQQGKAAPAAGAAPLPTALGQLAPHFNPQWAMDKLWEDGLAEVAVYHAERVIYNQVRRFEYVQLTVKEEFNQQYQVKTDDYSRTDLFPVLKVNQFCRIPTGQYPYHFLTSLFFRRESPTSLHELTTSSQEWCGNTFKAFLDDGQQYVQTYNSYWDGQGAGQRRLRRDMLFEDALPYALRSLRFRDGLAFQVNIAELQQTSKAAAPLIHEASISVQQAATAETQEAAWQVRVRLAEGKESTYWFARKYPNVLLRQAGWDGRNLRLHKLSRAAYWQRTAPDTTQNQL